MWVEQLQRDSNGRFLDKDGKIEANIGSKGKERKGKDTVKTGPEKSCEGTKLLLAEWRLKKGRWEE